MDRVKVARTCENLLQGVRGELLHRQLGYEGQLKERVRTMHAFSVTMGGGSFLGYRESIQTANLEQESM